MRKWAQMPCEGTLTWEGGSLPRGWRQKQAGVWASGWAGAGGQLLAPAFTTKIRLSARGCESGVGGGLEENKVAWK